jgi:hypothetical protein
VIHRAASCLLIVSIWGCELVVDDGTRVLAPADAGKAANDSWCQVEAGCHDGSLNASVACPTLVGCAGSSDCAD